MEKPNLYRGLWPQNISKTAKYAVRFVDRTWKVTVTYDLGEGLIFLAVEAGGSAIAERVNEIKRLAGDQEGGTFYVNEYQHLLIPVRSHGTSHYFFGGKVDTEFRFQFEQRMLTSRPVDRDGDPLRSGDPWVGPRPGIPYVLAAGGQDVYYQSPALTDGSPAQVRPNMTRKVILSKVLRDKAAVIRALSPIAKIRGYAGGRFYVNEHRAIFTPVGDENGLTYVYCGQVDLNNWFPEPRTF